MMVFGSLGAYIGSSGFANDQVYTVTSSTGIS